MIMKEKVLEYIEELNEEIKICEREIEESYSFCSTEEQKQEYDNSPRYHTLVSRIKTLIDVQADLESRISEYELGA